MTTTNSTDIKAALERDRAANLEQQEQLQRELDEIFAAVADVATDDEHDPEGSTIAYERSQLGAVTTQVHDHIREIDAALARVDAGTYGYCEICGRQIDLARMDARPTARACVPHASALGSSAIIGRNPPA